MASHPRPCMRSMSSFAAPSTTPSTADYSGSRRPPTHARRDHNAGRAPDPRHGAPCNSPSSCNMPAVNGCTRHCLAAATGMRRGEIAGLRWSDWNQTEHRLSINRSRQVVAGRSTEFAPKTRTSRRCIDLDPTTETHLRRWHERQHGDGLPAGADDPIFTNTAGNPLHAESISQLFNRTVARCELPRLRLHDLRHTHASLLVFPGISISGGDRI